MIEKIMTLSFFCLMIPLGLMARLFGWRGLDLRWRTEEQSYWLAHNVCARDKKRRYQRQI